MPDSLSGQCSSVCFLCSVWVVSHCFVFFGVFWGGVTELILSDVLDLSACLDSPFGMNLVNKCLNVPICLSVLLHFPLFCDRHK